MNPKIVFATLALFMVTSVKCQQCPPPKYQPELDCGKPSVRSGSSYVIGGKDATRGSWPWQALMLIKIKNKPFTPFCGGSLIGRDWVLTAAHCIDGLEKFKDNIKVRLGEHDTTKNEGSEVERGIARIVKHPGYDSKTYTNDLALLQLYDGGVKYNNYVKPVCLAEKDVPAGSYCWITGFGKIKHPGTTHTVLQEARLPIPTNKVCNAFNYRKLRIRVDDTMICGGDGGKTIQSGCHGDSGGPFVCHVNGKWELHGVVSWGNSHCKSSYSYSVFARVPRHMKWIKDSIGPVGSLYRYWNSDRHDHFYTMNFEELWKGGHGYDYEKIQCRLLRIQYSTSVPLYRYWGHTDNFYTTNFKELGTGKNGWKYVGVAGYCFPKPHPCTVPLYRYYRRSVGNHFYTTDAREIGTTTPGHVGKYGYKSEGVACYVYPRVYEV